MKLFQQGDFRLDPNTTPEMLKAKRERLAALMPQYGKAQYIGEGLTQLLHGIGSGRSERAMDAFQGERSAEAAQQFAAATGGPMSILGMRPQEQGASFTQDPNAPESIGSDTMAALGKPSNGGGPDAIRQGLISRGLPEYVADGFMMNFRDESGFDPGINEIAPTVPGSRGGFGLAQWTGPRRRALESFAAQQGADIADPNLQLDFLMTELQGPEAGAAKSIFAAQDSGEAAAAIVNDFLRPADEHRKSRTARYTGGQGYSGGAPATGQPMQGGQDMDALLQAQANPWLTQSQRAVLDGMISQRQSQQAAAEDRYWRQNDPAYQQGLIKGQLEIDAMRNPAPQKRDTQFIKGIGLVDSQTGETVNDFGGTGGGSADGTEYGLTPQYGTDKDGNLVLIQLAKDGTAKQTMLPDGVALQKGVEKLDLGTSFQWYNTVTGEAIGEKIPKDSQAEAANKARGTAIGGAQGDAQVAAAQDLQAGQNALDLLNSLRTDPNRTAGTGASALFNGIPATKGYDFNAKVEQAKSGAFMTAIQQMRGMGTLSNTEGSTATAAVTRMNAAMSEEGFLAALDDYEKIIMQGMERAKRNGAGKQVAPQVPPQDGTQNNDPLGLFQ